MRSRRLRPVCRSRGRVIPKIYNCAWESSHKKNKRMNSFSAKGVQAPKENFSGPVWVNMNIGGNDGYNTIIGTVTFEPKARTNWHTHSTGQILFVIDGAGYYQEKGKPAQTIRNGDVVKIPKNVIHWHGASHHSMMRHIAIVPESDKEKTQWLQPVTDEEYNAAGPLVIDAELQLSSAAVRNHELLWPDYISKAKDTDPDLIQVFDNFAFDEVISHDSMDLKARVLMIMAATIASQALTEYRMFVLAALNSGIAAVEIKEVVYQAVPYVGMAKVIDFIYATNDIFREKGIPQPVESQATTNPKNRLEKGLAKQKEIFGSRIDDMYKNSPKDLLHIQEYLSDNCFGDYVTRNGLDVRTREMLTLSFL